MDCPNCGKNVMESKFCSECGAKLIADETTENVGSNESGICESDAICQNSNHEPENQTISSSDFEKTSNVVLETNSKKKKTKLIVVLLCFLAVIAVVVCLFVFGNKGEVIQEEKQYSFYIKDNSLYYMNPNEKESILITESLLKDEDCDTDDINELNLFEFADNEKILFYPEKMDLEDASFTLYCKQMNKKKEEPVKLAEKVTRYCVSDDGKLVLFLDSSGNLYRHNMTEREKLFSDIEDFWVSDDCSSVACWTNEEDLYIQVLDGEKTKIDSKVECVYDISDDLKTVFYSKEGSLYQKKADEHKKKIDSDVFWVMISDENLVYYFKENEEMSGTLLDFIEDIKGQASKDETVVKGEKEVDSAENLEAHLRYWARETLKDRTYNFDTLSLFSYDGEKTDIVNSSCAYCYNFFDDSPIIKSYDSVNVKKVKISDFVNSVDKELKLRKTYHSGNYIYRDDFKNAKFIDKFEKMVKGAYETDATTYAILNGKTVNLTSKPKNKCMFNSDKSKIYYTTNIDEDKLTADLYEIKIKNGVVESNELYDSEISANDSITYDDNIGLIYFKDSKNKIADMYINKELIEYDVGSISIMSNGKMLYYTDYEEETSTGTAFLYSNGEAVKIDEEAYHAYEDANGNILYYKDRSLENDKGDLYIFKNSESTLIDFDVSYKVNVSSTDKYRFFSTYHSLLDDEDTEKEVSDTVEEKSGLDI